MWQGSGQHIDTLGHLGRGLSPCVPTVLHSSDASTPQDPKVAGQGSSLGPGGPGQPSQSSWQVLTHAVSIIRFEDQNPHEDPILTYY